MLMLIHTVFPWSPAPLHLHFFSFRWNQEKLKAVGSVPVEALVSEEGQRRAATGRDRRMMAAAHRSGTMMTAGARRGPGGRLDREGHGEPGTLRGGDAGNGGGGGGGLLPLCCATAVRAAVAAAAAAAVFAGVFGCPANCSFSLGHV